MVKFAKKVEKKFTPYWEHGHLGDIVKIVMGQSPSSINYTDNPEDHILVQGNADLENGHVVPRVWTKQVTKTADKDDIILSVRAPVGDVGITNYPIVIGRGVAAIKGNKFIYQLLDKMNQDSFWRKYSTGSTFESINSNDLKKAEIFHPNEPEQEKIGKLFQSLDRAIYLHEEKQRQLEQLKKALLQKMFADKKEYPELRFNGFSDSWNKNKVSELFTITRGYVLPAKDTKPTPEGDYCYPVYSSQTAQNGLMGYYNKYLYKDAITWTTDGANAGTVRFRTGKFYCTNVCGVLLTKKAKASEMIAMALNKVTKKYVSYVGNPKLMNNVMGEIVISLPTNTEEQNNLSFLFNNLERAIILTEHKIEQLKSLKQALLQQMFI